MFPAAIVTGCGPGGKLDSSARSVEREGRRQKVIWRGLWAVEAPASGCSLSRSPGHYGIKGQYCAAGHAGSIRHHSSGLYTDEEKALLDRIIRVDHAGEYGANRIYAGQMAVLGRSSVGPIIQHMWDQEKEHLKKFNELMVSNRVRPTALLPFWNVAGFALGFGTALLGRKGAMACTVAVEETISNHYNNQIRALMETDPEKHKELLQTIKTFRDEEMEHHDTGLEHDAELAPAYFLLKNTIQVGCRAAVYLSERI